MPISMEFTLVLPNQLFDQHPAIKKGGKILLLEDSLFFGDAKHPALFHKQKLMFHRASMKAYAQKLTKQGHDVIYKDYIRDAGIAEVLMGCGLDAGDVLHYVDPVDDVLERRLRRYAGRSGVVLKVHESPMFLTGDTWNEEFFGRSKQRFMSRYYKAQRLRLGVLVEADGQPLGGKWSFDEENRKPWPRGRPLPAEPEPVTSGAIDEARRYVEERFPENPGTTEPFWYETTRTGALRWLEQFLEERLREFGPFEDALCAHGVVLNHSVLTPYLNSGLLTPREVLDRAIEAGSNEEVPLNSLEGFVRQVIGWREFMRAMYRLHGVAQRNGNFWKCERRMPRAFYEGSTGIPPLDASLRKVREYAYCHHIERLMVLGNFMLLCRIHPDEVYRWFMEMFIDAYDWVMVPNVYGMSQFADGGIFSTKPYISGSNYLRKMGDYPAGPWCNVWDGLFWTFIDDHQDFFRAHPRLGMMTRQLDRMGATKLATHRKNADDFLASLQ